MTPVSGSASWKALAVLTASWPVMESTTNSISSGRTAPWMALISAIMASSTCRRPAVSTITTSMARRRASASSPRSPRLSSRAPMWRSSFTTQSVTMSTRSVQLALR